MIKNEGSIPVYSQISSSLQRRLRALWHSYNPCRHTLLPDRQPFHHWVKRSRKLSPEPSRELRAYLQTLQRDRHFEAKGLELRVILITTDKMASPAFTFL